MEALTTRNTVTSFLERPILVFTEYSNNFTWACENCYEWFLFYFSFTIL